MAKLNLTQKTNRVLSFLLGVRSPQISTKMVEHGFTQSDLDEGWSLMHRAVDARLDLTPKAAPPPNIIQELDAFENKWFPIAKATLARHHPEVHDRVFMNLNQTSGGEVVVSVNTFIERVEGLGTTDDGEPDPEGQAARDLLASRGLDTNETDRALLLILGMGELGEVPEVEVDMAEIEAAREAAEQEMWSWYLEWSTIARTAITNRNHLRRLGFLRNPSPPTTVEAPTVSPDAPAETAAPSETPEEPETVETPA